MIMCLGCEQCCIMLFVNKLSVYLLCLYVCVQKLYKHIKPAEE